VVNKGRSQKKKQTRTEKEKDQKRLRRLFFLANGLTMRGFVLKSSKLLLDGLAPENFRSHNIWHNIPYAVLRSVDESLLDRLRLIETKIASVLKNGDIADHKYGANVGYNLGYSIVSGGTHAGKSKNVSGSIHWCKTMKARPELRAELGSVFAEILENAFGSDPWYRRLKQIAENVRREENGRFLDGMPLSAWWWTRFPKKENVHCDRNVVGATFLLTTATVHGATFVGMNPNGKTMRHRLKAGTIMGGTWAQHAHCNSPSSEIVLAQRTTWTLYLDKRVFSKKYIVTEPNGFRK
jgi:hypothetical protein